MKTSNISFVNAIVGIAGLVGIGYGLAMHTKLSKISERLDKSIDDLADDMEIDIPDELVNKAVEKAVANAAKYGVNAATNSAVSEVKHDIHRKVQAAVDKEYESVKDNVLKEITVSASKIDEARVRREVEAAAKKMALDKFDVNLEGILDGFNDKLENTAKIYSAIQNVLNPATINTTQTTPKEYVFRVG